MVRVLLVLVVTGKLDLVTMAIRVVEFPMKKKIEKDSDNFWHRKLTLKVKFWHFLKARH